jgi:hypothetical protein
MAPRIYLELKEELLRSAFMISIVIFQYNLWNIILVTGLHHDIVCFQVVLRTKATPMEACKIVTVNDISIK